MSSKLHDAIRRDYGGLPSVTEILKLEDTEGLVAWAAQRGGQAYSDRKAAADHGTLAHEVLEQQLRGLVPDVSSYEAFSAGATAATLIEEDAAEILCLEEKLHWPGYYAGTPDCIYLDKAGTLVVADLKTGSKIDWKVPAQLAGYLALYLQEHPEHAHRHCRGRILWQPRGCGSAVVDVSQLQLLQSLALFNACLTLQTLRRELDWKEPKRPTTSSAASKDLPF